MGYKKVVAAFYRGVLSARYRVRLEGAGITGRAAGNVVFA